MSGQYFSQGKNVNTLANISRKAQYLSPRGDILPKCRVAVADGGLQGNESGRQEVKVVGGMQDARVRREGHRMARQFGVCVSTEAGLEGQRELLLDPEHGLKAEKMLHFFTQKLNANSK